MPRANPWIARAGPKGTRPSPAVDPWRARVPAKPAIPAATTGSALTRRCASASSRACPAPLSTWTWRLMRKPENGGGIATVVSARTCSSRASPNQSLRRTGSRRTRIRREPPARRRAGPRHCARRARDCLRARAAVMAALRLECPAAWPQAAPAPGPARRAATTSARTATARTRSRPAMLRGKRKAHTSLMACPPGPSSAGPAAASRACQYGRNKVASSSRPSARRRPDEIGLRRAGRHDGPGIRIARPRRFRHAIRRQARLHSETQGKPPPDRAISWYAGSPEPAACRPWAMP